MCLDGLLTTFEEKSTDILDLDEALTVLQQLGGQADRAARVVELRFFGGMSMPEIAELLGVALRTVKRDWQFAQAWLARRLR